MIINNERQRRPPNDEPTEESPLLAEQDDEVPPPNKISMFMKFQRAHLIIPVIFLGFLAGTLPSTTSIEILRVLCCQFWWKKHDPSRIPTDGRIPAELCDAPGVQKFFSQIFQAFMILDVCGGLITSSPLGILAAKFGRKPLLIIVAAVAMVSSFITIPALHSGSLFLLCLGQATAALAGPRQFALLSTMFIVDSASNPGPILSVLEGSVNLGIAISYASGGLITTRTGNYFTVFWVQTGVCALILLYIIIAVPETFGPDKRAARAAEVAAERARGRSYVRPRLRSRSSSLERIRDTTSTFARPLGFIWPRRDPATGKRNKRLFVLSISMAFALVGATYLGGAWLVFATNRFHATPEHNGYTLSVLSSIKTIYLLFVLPIILRWGRPFFNRRWRASHSELDENSDSSHFDVYVLAASWAIDATAILGIGLSQSLRGITFWLMLVSIGSGAAPCISSIVSASVEPLARGEALAAVTLVRAVSEFFSPIILGSILSSTINTSMPQLVFFIASILMAAGVGVVLLIRDSDRYIPPDERVHFDATLYSDGLRPEQHGFGGDGLDEE
ncbi:Sugar (and other) transporter [Ceratobasidium sp. AG-Ba]|nr:Sugar (and other) transporter [Ceratobasidium sp. AG-Ba]